MIEPNITKLRRQLASLVDDLPGIASVNVKLGQTDYGKAGEINFLITAIVGPPTPENEEVVDGLYNTVREAIDGADSVNAFTSRCSGHRLYAESAQTPPSLGCEWQVKVLA